MLTQPAETREKRPPIQSRIASADAMTAFGTALAPLLHPGDLVALSGPLGAGKSHLARAIIQARLGDPRAEVPSPTYTLVNVYDAAGIEIWHADLYRLAGADDLTEIGLDDAIGHAITLVEWPERWPNLPQRLLSIDIATLPDDARDVTLTLSGDWPSLVGIEDLL